MIGLTTGSLTGPWVLGSVLLYVHYVLASAVCLTLTDEPSAGRPSAWRASVVDDVVRGTPGDRCVVEGLMVEGEEADMDSVRALPTRVACVCVGVGVASVAAAVRASSASQSTEWTVVLTRTCLAMSK